MKLKLTTLLFALCAVLALAGFTGCTSTGDATEPVGTSDYVATACATTAAAMEVVTVATEQDRLDAEQRDKVRKALGVIRPICSDPSMSLTPAQEVGFVEAVADIAAAHAAARSSE